MENAKKLPRKREIVRVVGSVELQRSRNLERRNVQVRRIEVSTWQSFERSFHRSKASGG